MKVKNYLYIGVVSMLLVGGIVSCEDDLEHYTVSDLTPTTDFALSDSKVQIDEENLSENVLNLIYSKSALNVTNGDVVANLDGGYIVLQASKDESFGEYKTFSGNNLTTLKGDDINDVAIALGLTPNVESTMYLRLASSIGKNSENVLYSNIVKLNVTPLEIDSHWAYLYTKDDEDKFTVKSSQYVFSPDNDGKYQGFINATAWLNFSVHTQDDVVYGTSEGTGWTFMSYMAGGDHFWLTAKAGCYYFTMDTKNTSELANAYLISSLSCAGDVSNASMVWDATKSAWYAYIIVPKDNANVTINGKAEHYQSSQADADEIVNVGFSGTQNDVKFSLGEEGTGVTIAEKGTYKLTLKLGLNSKYKFTLEPAEVTVYPTELTLSGNKFTTEMLDGAATGVYTGFVNLKSGVQEIKVSDDKDYGVSLDVVKDGWYYVTVDLVKKRTYATLYGNTLTASDNWTGTLTIKDGKYVGVISPIENAEKFDFYLTDENDQKYGTYQGWDQYTFGVSEGDYNHLWLNPSYGDAYIEIDVVNHSWDFVYKNALLMVSEDGSSIIATFGYDETKKTYNAIVKRESGEWNYFLKGINSTNDGIEIFGADDEYTKADGVNATGVVSGRSYGDHNLWVDPEKTWAIVVDLENSIITYTEVKTPDALYVYGKDKETQIAALTADEEEIGVFKGTLSLSDNEWNFFIKGTFTDGSDPIWYGSNGSSAEVLVIGGSNLWADPANTYDIVVDLNNSKVTYTEKQ